MSSSPVLSSEKPPEPQEPKPSEKKALLELRAKLEQAIQNNCLLRPRHRPAATSRVACSQSHPDAEKPQTEVSLWGVPLLPSKCHPSTDQVLLKFLRAQEGNATEAYEMLQKTLRWRTEFGTEGILDEELGMPELERVAYLDGTDIEGHPICYNVFGVFKDEELYDKAFGDEEKCDKFIRWRVRFMEKGIKEGISIKPGGDASMVQITDLKNSLSPSMRELRSTSRKAISVLQDNYPGFVHKNIFVNVSFRYYFYHALCSPFMDQRTKSKFIFARPQKVAETLLKFIAPERLPVQYGGFKREKDDEFSVDDKVLELVVKGGETENVEILIFEPGLTAVWDLTVVGWEVNYKEEFIPDDEGSYRVLIRNKPKLEESIRNSFYISEPGKVVLTIENRSYKRKKKVLYRCKIRPTVYMYNLLSKKHHPLA